MAAQGCCGCPTVRASGCGDSGREYLGPAVKAPGCWDSDRLPVPTAVGAVTWLMRAGCAYTLVRGGSTWASMRPSRGEVDLELARELAPQDTSTDVAGGIAVGWCCTACARGKGLTLPPCGDMGRVPGSGAVPGGAAAEPTAEPIVVVVVVACTVARPGHAGGGVRKRPDAEPQGAGPPLGTATAGGVDDTAALAPPAPPRPVLAPMPSAALQPELASEDWRRAAAGRLGGDGRSCVCCCRAGAPGTGAEKELALL